ncbi:hypothetical protein ES702_02329 [subsurface metagenome]
MTGGGFWVIGLDGADVDVVTGLGDVEDEVEVEGEDCVGAIFSVDREAGAYVKFFERNDSNANLVWLLA